MNKYQKSGILPSPRRHGRGTNSNLEKQTSISKEWASQFWVKQYYKSKYNLSERRLRTIVENNKAADSCTKEIINTLDHKLDTIIFSLGWAKNLKEARHYIKRNKVGIIKKIENNGVKATKNLIITNPNIKIRIGETIYITKPNSSYNININSSNKGNFLIKKDKEKITATLLRPTSSKLGGEISARKFELYCQKWN